MTELSGPGHALTRVLVDSRRTDAGVVLTVYGELDVESVPDFELALASAEREEPNAIVLDLVGLNFTDSAGLRALVGARRRAASSGYTLTLRRVPSQARKVLELTGTLDYFTIEED